MKRNVNGWIAGCIALLGVASFAWQLERSRHLKQEISERRDAVRGMNYLQSENQRLHDLLADPESVKSASEKKTEMMPLHEEIAAWERMRQQQESVTGRVAPAQSSSANTPPQFTRVEQFQNAGQATPGAAFQTLVWAVTKGEEAALTTLLAITPAGREKLTAVWNKLSPESQAKFKEPQRLVTLLLAMEILDEDGYEIVGETRQEDGDMLLRVSRYKYGVNQGEKRIPLRQSPAGWQFVIPDQLMEELPDAIAQASLYVAPVRQ